MNKICETQETWGQIIECTDPYSWAYTGIGISMGVSILGAIWGIYLTGTSLLGSTIKTPRIRTKNLISVVFCEAVAIYGVIMSIMMAQKVTYSDTVYTNEAAYRQAMRSAMSIFWTGVSVGFSNLICGMAIGVTGSGAALADAQEPSTFIKVLVIEIISSALGLFGLIIGVMQSALANFPK